MSATFVPGPVDVALEVLTAQTRPWMPQRSKDFEAIFQGTDQKLKQLFFTRYRVFQATASGSGMHEAGVSNFTQERVLSCVNGAFTERTQMWASTHGMQPLARESRRSKILMAGVDRPLAAMQEFIAAK